MGAQSPVQAPGHLSSSISIDGALSRCYGLGSVGGEQFTLHIKHSVLSMTYKAVQRKSQKYRPQLCALSFSIRGLVVESL